MKQIALKYGLASGAVIVAMFAITLPLGLHSELLGYSTMVLAFLLVFFGIRAYRDDNAGGSIGFGKAFQVGLLITLVACGIYVAAWEVYYFGFAPDFLEHYSASAIEQMRRAGESEAAIAEAQAEMASFAELYKNPLINIGVTFLEIFPVGLVMTGISAGILRRKPTEAAVAIAIA